MKKFLQNGSNEAGAKAKVLGMMYAKPRVKCGFGILQLETWNKAVQLKHIWSPCDGDEDALQPSWVMGGIQTT